MSGWAECVLDATMGYPFCFCPIDGNIRGEFSVITGANFIGQPPRGCKVVAVVHADGQKAVEAFYAQYSEEISEHFQPQGDGE